MDRPSRPDQQTAWRPPSRRSSMRSATRRRHAGHFGRREEVVRTPRVRIGRRAGVCDEPL
eukprot:scaffold2179_cov84-Isochrysis_galbana.AAC.4